MNDSQAHSISCPRCRSLWHYDFAGSFWLRVGRSLGLGFMLAWCFAIAMSCLSYANGTSDVVDHTGSVMQGPTVFLIFWSAGKSYDSGASDGMGNYESVITRFFSDLSGTDYLDMVTQYPGTCGSNQSCHTPVTLGGVFTDTAPYPHAGTSADPLLDSDIQMEITSSILKNPGWHPGLNALFFVFTAENVQECTDAAHSQCTGNSFCAYHSFFTFNVDGNPFNGSQVIYAFMPDVFAIMDPVVGLFPACTNGLSTSVVGWSSCPSAPNNQLSTDAEIVAASHEFFEAVSDPQLDAWFDDSVGSEQSEIGDKCVLGYWASWTSCEAGLVTLNNNQYAVQKIWSNNDSSCALSFTPPILGSCVEYKIESSGPRGDSSAIAALTSPLGSNLQTNTLKQQGQAGWDNSSIHVRVFGLDAQPSPVGSVGISITAHPNIFEGADYWNIDSLDLKIRDPAGNQLCEGVIDPRGIPAGLSANPTDTRSFDTVPLFTSCSNSCVDLKSNTENCGSCGNRCTQGFLCTNGSCGCPTVGHALCSGICVSTSVNNRNCGACGNACDINSQCISGQCVPLDCPRGFHDCCGNCVRGGVRCPKICP